MKGPDDDEGDDVIQRRVAAADASPLYTPAGSSVFNWRGGTGTAAPSANAHTDTDEDEDDTTPSQQPQEQEKPTMPTTRHRAPRSGPGSPQVQLCTALLQNGDLTNEQLAKVLPQFNVGQIRGAINNATANERVKLKGDAHHLTAKGKAWLQAAGIVNPAAAEKPASPSQKTAAAQPPVDTTPPSVDTSQAGQEPTFRCAVMSDGAFFISKGGTHIELDAMEHAQMLHYLERMAVPA
jgi:hypothetical protein